MTAKKRPLDRQRLASMLRHADRTDFSYRYGKTDSSQRTHKQRRKPGLPVFKCMEEKS